MLQLRNIIGLASLMSLGAALHAQTTVTTTGGTTNAMPIYTGSSTLGNAPISVSGNNVGIGTASPVDHLSIFGTDTNKVGIGIQNFSGTPTGLSLLTGGATGFGISGWANSSIVEGESPNGLILDSINTPGNDVGGPIAFQINRSTVAVISTTGRLGIGTVSPAQALEINGSVQIDNGAAIFAPNNFGVYTGDGSYFFRTGSPSSYSDRFYIANAGNVGIGTVSPGAKLDVNGSVKISGAGGSLAFSDNTVQSTAWTGVLSGGDYAESVNVSGDRTKYEPGDVLVIDPKAEGSFLKSSTPYSTSVTGIYSTKPGVTGRRQHTSSEHMKEEVPMAMTGIVPTKVITENGPIKPGDLLVTSSKVGYAMKGTDRSQMLGAVIGKAIGHLDAGTGIIEAVVTLQ